MPRTAPRARVGPLLGRAYRRVYSALAGTHPHPRIWHFQWLALAILYRSLRAELETLHGRVLDVGCGTKPYRDWVPGATAWLGLDVSPGPDVDLVIDSGAPWPLGPESFDVVVCTQVLEHAIDPEATLREITQVLVPGGTLVLTVPFIFNEHANPDDYRRLSRHGARRLVEVHGLTVEKVERQGGVGSSAGVLLLNWLDMTLTASGAGVLLLFVLLPLWLTFCTAVNLVGVVLDRLDRTTAFYGNVLVRAVKPARTRG